MSHITYIHEPCHTYKRVMSCHTRTCVVSHTYMSHATHIHESCHTHICLVTYMSHVPCHIHEACATHESVSHTHPCAMSHTYITHTTHIRWSMSSKYQSWNTNPWVMALKSIRVMAHTFIICGMEMYPGHGTQITWVMALKLIIVMAQNVWVVALT